MIRPILVLVALVALLGAAHAQWNDNAEDCYLATLPETDITPDLAIHYCSKAIESGELSNENLAETFNNRGRLYDDTGDYRGDATGARPTRSVGSSVEEQPGEAKTNDPQPKPGGMRPERDPREAWDRA